jgi:hypothetical protein
VHLRVPHARAGQCVIEVAIGVGASSLTTPSTARLTLIR